MSQVNSADPEGALREYDQNAVPTKEEETALESAADQEKCTKTSRRDRSSRQKSRNLFPRMDPITSKGFIARVMLQLETSNTPKSSEKTKVIVIILAAVFLGVLIAVIFKYLGFY